MLPLHRLALLCCAPLLLTGLSSLAQNLASKPLIAEKVDENQLVTLRGNTPPAALAENDRGRVSPSLPMTGIILVLRRSPEEQAAFDAFVASQYDPTSPDYHHWLEPEEVGEKFGPALADIATVSSWLSSHGLSVEEVSKDRMTIRFSGTAAQVQDAFHTEIHNLVVKGEPHISNMTDPQIPMALDPVVLGPKALHNFTPRPLHRTGAVVKLNRETGRWERAPLPTASAAGAHPEFGITSCSGSPCLLEDVAPYDFAAIYNVLPMWNASTPIDGTGQTIAIAGRSDVRASDVSQFRTTFGLTGGAFNTIHNGTDPGYCTSTSSTALCTLDDQTESALDVEWSGAIAKGATIDLIVTPQTNTNDAIFESAKYVIDNKTASIINVSYGLCELAEGTSGNAAYNNLWESASTGGIAVFVSTGDSGSASCDQGGDSAGTPYSAKYGLSVSGIASTPFNTAVGGTDLNWGSTASPYWNATNNSANGSTARGYIPETPWNDSCTNPLALPFLQSVATYLNNHAVSAPSPTDAESACNFVVNYWSSFNSLTGSDISSLVDTVGGSGGASNCTSSDGSTVASCTGGYAKPSWQGGVTGIPNDNKRDIPDVSFFAGNGILGSAYLICVSDAGACVSSATDTTEPVGQEIGGTSVASPAMAGVMALINQKVGAVQGNPNSELYILAGKQTYSSCSAETVVATSGSCYFNDIDTGTNAMPCASGSPNCTVSTGGDTVGVLNGFSGATGYDEATGLGSLNVTNIVNGFAAVSTGSATATVGVSASPSSITSAQGTTVTVAVTGASGTPTGTVQLSSGTFVSASKSLSTGSVTFTLSPGLLAVGTDTVRASYSGDATYAAASGTTTVTVTQVVLIAPTVTVTPASSSVDTGQTLNVTATATGAGPTPTGTVTLSGGGYTSSAHTLAAGSYTFAIPANSLSVGTDTLTVTYGGDGTYSSGTGTASVTVTASAFALAATTPASVTKGSSATSTITLTSPTAYTGTVTLTCALTTSPAGATDLPACSAAGGSTITVAAGTPTGTGSVTVTTTAATAMMKKPPVGGWAEAGSGAVLALLVFFGIPARRRGWRAVLGALVLLATFGSLAACGGGGSSGGGNSGTTSGAYTFTVTGTGNPAVAPTPTTTFTVTVN
jgi:Pro-kumamolisin, activation domain/Bacterial Ig-like domain (group 3)